MHSNTNIKLQRNFIGGKVWPACKADNCVILLVLIVKVRMEAQHFTPLPKSSGLVMGKLYLYLTVLCYFYSMELELQELELHYNYSNVKHIFVYKVYY